MIITPIHTNLTTNIPKSNMISNNKTAVFKPTFQGDVNYMESLINSESISNLVDKNRFKEAYILINRLKDNFYPNYIDRRTKIPLLLKLARKQKNYFIRKSDKNLNYINEIMIQIINHKDFNPNIPITLVDKRGNKYKSTYIEEAINKENTHFATIIEGYMEGINDPYNDSFNTLISNAEKSNSSILTRSIINIASYELTHINNNQSEKVIETYNQTKDDNNGNVSEEGKILLQQIKVNIGDDIPESLDNIGGMSEAKKIIENYIIKAWQPDKKAQIKENNTSMPNGFLLYGPPGCGKTFITNIIAKQTGYPLYSLSIKDIGSNCMGDVPRRLNYIFTALEEQYKENGEKIPSILFIDELDDMGVARNDSYSPGKKEDLIALLTLTNNVGNKGIILIGATNYPEGIDKALLRKGRFDKLIKIELPSKEERKDILKKLLESKPKVKHLLKDIDLLADKTDGKTPADIAGYLNECILSNIMSDTQSPITVEDFTKLIEKFNPQERNHIGFNQ